MRKSEVAEAWVIYKMTIWGKLPGPNAVCEQGEWDAMELAKPGHRSSEKASPTKARRKGWPGNRRAGPHPGR